MLTLVLYKPSEVHLSTQNDLSYMLLLPIESLSRYIKLKNQVYKELVYHPEDHLTKDNLQEKLDRNHN
jgi:hypothetical protein